MRLTYGQLVDAATAKRFEQWDHTSHVLWLIHNANRDPSKGSPSRIEDWHPLRKRKRRKSNYTGELIRNQHDQLAKTVPVQVISLTPDQVIEE